MGQSRYIENLVYRAISGKASSMGGRAAGHRSTPRMALYSQMEDRGDGYHPHFVPRRVPFFDLQGKDLGAKSEYGSSTAKIRPAKAKNLGNHPVPPFDPGTWRPTSFFGPCNKPMPNMLRGTAISGKHDGLPLAAWNSTFYGEHRGVEIFRGRLPSISRSFPKPSESSDPVLQPNHTCEFDPHGCHLFARPTPQKRAGG